jgi:uncharacterized protein (TIGR03435 family)
MSYSASFKLCAVLALSSVYTAAAQVDANSASLDQFSFEVASIRLTTNYRGGPGALEVLPDGIRARSENTYSVLEVAFLPPDASAGRDTSITNAPDWVISDKYDIDARVAEKDLKDWGTQVGVTYRVAGNTAPYLRAALRNLLKDRYKLRAHLVETQVPYVSIMANANHNKLVAVPDIPPTPEHAMKLPSGGRMILTRGQDENMTWTFFGCTMDDLASVTTQNFEQLAQDKSGLRGRYNFEFTLNRRDLAEDRMTWMKGIESLGLRLRNDKGPGRNLVIDHIERPQPD